nr:immunoglobulin heavy chain junction region [Mus musculus]
CARHGYYAMDYW